MSSLEGDGLNPRAISRDDVWQWLVFGGLPPEELRQFDATLPESTGPSMMAVTNSRFVMAANEVTTDSCSESTYEVMTASFGLLMPSPKGGIQQPIRTFNVEYVRAKQIFRSLMGRIHQRRPRIFSGEGRLRTALMVNPEPGDLLFLFDLRAPQDAE